jgi:3alpha(or 20beta)-hydroxysteroid dehydrogenase
MAAILITGASGVLGGTIARLLNEREHTVILACNDGQPLENSPTVAAIYGDLTDDTYIDKLGWQIEEKHIDVIVNCAGLYYCADFENTPMAIFRQLLEVNTLASISLLKQAWPLFKRNGYGLVVNVNSTAGMTGSNGESAYNVSKFGLKGFSDSIKFDAMQCGIVIMDFYPGGFQSVMTAGREEFEKMPTAESVAIPIVNSITMQLLQKEKVAK